MKKKGIYIIVSVVFLIIIVVLFLKFGQERKSSRPNDDKVNGVIVPVTQFTSALPDIKWFTYENSLLGLSFNYPEKAVPNKYWTAPDYIGDKITATHILTNDDVLYISLADSSFDSVETKWQKDKQEYTGKSLDPSWRMTIKNVADETALGDFVKEQYGASCSYKKVATEFLDTYNIIIESDGKSLDKSQCPVNYDYYIKYSPVNQVAVSWNTSQECQLGLNLNNCFDKQIAASFHFINKEPLIYSVINASVLKETEIFDFTPEQLETMVAECGTKHKTGYFDNLVDRFNSSTKLIYKFKYQGASQEPDTFIVTLLPNRAGYTSLDQFKNDFEMCAVAGDAYPMKLNNKWLLFISSCESGYGDDSGNPIGCDEVRKNVEPSLKLN